MTPQLRQAIEILQMNNQDLLVLVEEELAKNPLLQKDQTDQDQNDSEGDFTATEKPDAMQAQFEGQFQESQDFDSGSDMARMGSGGNTQFDVHDYDFQDHTEEVKSLRHHLLDQLAVCVATPQERVLCEMLIDRLDAAGYLREPLDQLAQDLGCSVEVVDDLLYMLKRFDPSGIFAENLAECLRLQLEDQKKLDTGFDLLLQNLSYIEKGDLKGLAKICNLSVEEVQARLKVIRTLNPKPAAQFDHMVVQTLVPDVLMKARPKHLGGGWLVELNHHTLPKLLVNQTYAAEISTQTFGKEDKNYVQSQLQAASWLVKALDQRAQTILKVAAEIVEHQEAFFLYGIEFLRPLTLKDVAEKIQMHESTVSRVTSGKYIGTPRGLFELKFFFTNSLTGQGGLDHTPEFIKSRIKTIIDGEQPSQILSDDKIMQILEKEGIHLARRTVVKYRESMNIQSSVDRRRIKRMAG
jgi:RNA polymerase sigma-54 factor